jgi:hypothetical protein
VTATISIPTVAAGFVNLIFLPIFGELPEIKIRKQYRRSPTPREATSDFFIRSQTEYFRNGKFQPHPLVFLIEKYFLSVKFYR